VLAFVWDGEHCRSESGEEGDGETHFGFLLLTVDLEFVVQRRHRFRSKFRFRFAVGLKELG